jgi:hypothetical protein
MKRVNSRTAARESREGGRERPMDLEDLNEI